MTVTPYVFFDGNCAEAIEFYREAVGATVGTVTRYKDAPDQTMIRPGMAEKIMHAAMTIGTSTILASDGGCDGLAKFGGFSLAITAATVDDAQRQFAAMAAGGTVRMPMAKTFWSPAFGMLTDKFGVGWMVMAEAG